MKKNQTLFLWGCLVLAAGSFLFGQTAAAAPADRDTATWFVNMNAFGKGAHKTLKCEECHGPMITMENGRWKMHPAPEDKGYLKTDAKKKFDYAACARCHKTAHERYLKGEHAEAAQKQKSGKPPEQKFDAPVCGDCHSAHYDVSHRSRVDAGIRMTQTCGKCHPDQQASFMANYHGKAAVNLGYDKAAFCTDCHGAHTVVSLKDKKQIAQTCSRCHPDAKPGFADIIIHDSKTGLDQKSEAKQSGLKRVHTLGALSLIFVVSLLVFFYTHSGLLLLRQIQEKLRRHK